jgi:Domain of unknown function (DUF6249)
MGPDVLVPFIFFCFLAAVILGPLYLAHKGRLAKIELMKQALERGQNLDPKLLEQLYEVETVKKRPDQPRRSLGAGVVLTFLAVGLGGAGFLSEGFDPSGMSDSGLYVAALIVGCIGMAYMVLAAVDYASKKKNGEAG